MLAIAAHPANESLLAAVVVGAVSEDNLTARVRGGFCLFVGDVDRVWEGCDWSLADFEKGYVIFLTAWVEEDYAESSAAGSPCAATAVDESLGVCGWVDLDNQVDGWDVQSAGCDIGCEEDGGGLGGGEAGEILLADICWVFSVERDKVEVLSEYRWEDCGKVVNACAS